MSGAPLRHCVSGQAILIAQDKPPKADVLREALSNRGAEVVGPVSTVADGLAIVASGRPLDSAVLELDLSGECAYPLVAALLSRGVRVVLAAERGDMGMPKKYRRIPLLVEPYAPDTVVEELATTPPFATERMPSNLILDSLDTRDKSEIVRRGRHMTLPRGCTLGARHRERFSYFLAEGVASVRIVDSRRQSAEVAMIGCEGLCTLSRLMPQTQTWQTTMIVSGSAIAIDAKVLDELARGSPQLAARIEAETTRQALLLARSALTAARYSTRARVARWLLMLDDRVPGDELPVTHDQIAWMLGVRRASVSVVLRQLRGIKADRGHICITDRKELLRASTGCYDASDDIGNGVLKR